MNVCKNCGARLEINTPDSIGVGNVSICFKCGEISVFRKDLTLRPITQEELLDIQVNYPIEYFQIEEACMLIKSPRKEKTWQS